MEAALKPQVLETLDQIADLYKKLGKLQDASVEAALAVRRTFHRPGTPLQEAAQRDRSISSRASSSTTTASKRWSTRCTASTAVWSSLEGRLLRLAEAHGVDRADFLKQHFGNELDPNWARRVGRLSRPRLEGFRPAKSATSIKRYRDEIQTLAQEMRQSIVDFRRIVQTVQKGERESGVRRRRK